MRFRALAACVCLAAAPCRVQAAEPPAPSTAPVRARPAPPAENPWSLSYGVARSGERRGRVDYRLRFDFTRPSSFRIPPHSVEGAVRGLLRGTQFEYHGLRVRPFRGVPLLRTDAFAVAGATSTAPVEPAAATPARRFYSWERIYEEVRFNACREGERFLLREAFDRALPAYRDVSYGDKRALAEGVLSPFPGGEWSCAAEP